MNRRKYKYQDYNKSEPTEDATKYFVVYEGKSKEPNYFEAFNENFIDPRKAFVCHILEEDTGIEGNTPLKLKERAEKFIKEPPNNVKVTPSNDDKFRFVLDVDKHNLDHLNELNEYCKSLNDGNLFISNYCFEIWLWSHIEDLNQIQSSKSSQIKEEFSNIQSLNFPHSFMKFELIENAIKRCEQADTNKIDFVPVTKSSKVYILIQELLQHSHLNIEVQTETEL